MDWPDGMFPGGPLVSSISTAGLNSIGTMLNPSTAATAWPTANLAIFVPFRIPIRVTAYQMACGSGSAAGSNIDLGIYDVGGNRLVSSGSTARPTSGELVTNITDTLLEPGMYYMALACDGTDTIIINTLVNAGFGKIAGVRQQTSAFALPSTATFATYDKLVIPVISIYLRAD